MATVEVNTWDEFKNAIQNDWTENKTINIMSDIDVSDTVLTSSVTKPLNNYTITINGNDHKINGLTSYSRIYLFTLNRATVNNVHFSNISAINAWFSKTNGWYNSAEYTCNWNHCFFNGVLHQMCESGYATYNNGQFYNYCSINIKAYQIGGSGSSTYTGHFNYCYIIYETILTSTSYPTTIGGDYNNCYIGGKFEFNRSGSSSIADILSGYNAPVRCCYNLECLNHNTGSFTVYLNATSAQYTLFNTSKMSNPSTTTYVFANQMIGLTDTEIKDPAVISAQTNNTFLYQD